MARQGEDMRRGVTAHVRAQLDRFSQLLRGGTAASRAIFAPAAAFMA
jgi:hypothetical protein